MANANTPLPLLVHAVLAADNAAAAEPHFNELVRRGGGDTAAVQWAADIVALERDLREIERLRG